MILTSGPKCRVASHKLTKLGAIRPRKCSSDMKSILLAALALPVLLTGCATDVAVGGGYGPGYYDGGYYGYDGPVVGIYGGGGYGYGNGRGYHHYDNGHNSAFASRTSHAGGNHNSVAGVSHSSAHVGASHSSSASVSAGGGHSGGGGFGGGGGRR